MEYERWQYYERQHGIQEGVAKQKAEDEKVIAKITAQKDAEIAKLKAQLAAALNKK